MKRRRWLMGLSWSVVGTSLAGFTAFLTGCQSKGTKDGFAEFVAVAVLDEAGSVLQDYFAKDPIVVVRDPQNKDVIHAVNAFCTHQRCLVTWNQAQKVFICPCHGSTFGADGKYLQGVATQPLETFPAKIDGKSVWVKA